MAHFHNTDLSAFMATFNALVQKSETPQEALTTLAEWPHSIIGETARHVVRGDYDKNHPLFHGLDTVLKEGSVLRGTSTAHDIDGTP